MRTIIAAALLAAAALVGACLEPCESHADCPAGLVCSDVTGEQLCLHPAD